MVLPILFGAAQAGLGIMSAFGAQQQRQSAVDSRNRSIRQEYRSRLAIRNTNWNNAVKRYELQKQDYREQLKENDTAAVRGFASEQMRLKEIFKRGAFTRQEQYIQKQQALGSIQARGQAGNSIARLSALTQGAFGRNEAILQASEASAVDNYYMRGERIRDQLRIANRNAYRAVQFAPQMGAAPLQPVYQNSPSNMGLYTGIAQGVMSGLETGYRWDGILNG